MVCLKMIKKMDMVFMCRFLGRKYSGNWKNDKMYGNGVMTNNKEKYVGVWDFGKLIRKKESIF